MHGDNMLTTKMESQGSDQRHICKCRVKEEKYDLLLPVTLLRVDPLLPVHILAHTLWHQLFLTGGQTGVGSEGQLLKDASLFKQPSTLNHPLQKHCCPKFIFSWINIHTRLTLSVVPREFLSFSLSTSISSGWERWSWSDGLWLEEDRRAGWFRLEENTESSWFSSSKLISEPCRLNWAELGSVLVSDLVVGLSSRALMVSPIWLTSENFSTHRSSRENADTDLHTLSSRCLAALIWTMISEVREESYLARVKQCPF